MKILFLLVTFARKVSVSAFVNPRKNEISRRFYSSLLLKINAWGTGKGRRIGVCSVLGGFEAHLHMALRRKVVNFVGLNLLHNANEVGAIGEVAIVQMELPVWHVWVLVKLGYPLGSKNTRAALYSMNYIPF